LLSMARGKTHNALERNPGISGILMYFNISTIVECNTMCKTVLSKVFEYNVLLDYYIVAYMPMPIVNVPGMAAWILCRASWL